MRKERNFNLICKNVYDLNIQKAKRKTSGRYGEYFASRKGKIRLDNKQIIYYTRVFDKLSC